MVAGLLAALERTGADAVLLTAQREIVAAPLLGELPNLFTLLGELGGVVDGHQLGIIAAMPDTHASATVRVPFH